MARSVITAGATDPRNVSLCDILFGLRAMERAGTGLVDVNKLMIEAGGESAFFHNQHEGTFSAIVRQPATTAGSKLVAHSTHPTGVYVLNLLPVTARFWNNEATVDLADCGVFIARSFEKTLEFTNYPFDVG